MASKEDNNDTEFDYADEFFTKSPQDTVESEDTNAIDQTENPTGNAPTEVNDGVNQIKPGNELPELSNLEDTAMKSTHKNQASMNDITLEPSTEPEIETGKPRVETDDGSDGEVDKWDELQLDPKNCKCISILPTTFRRACH